jgi:hypothetical protein
VDDRGQRRTNALAGLAAGALLVALLVASFLVARWTGARVGLEEGLRLVESAEPEGRLLGLAKLKGNPRAAPVFARLLDDPDARVRLTAALMLAGVAGLDATDATDSTGDDLVERMNVWWKLEGRARHGDE